MRIVRRLLGTNVLRCYISSSHIMFAGLPGTYIVVISFLCPHPRTDITIYTSPLSSIFTHTYI